MKQKAIYGLVWLCGLGLGWLGIGAAGCGDDDGGGGNPVCGNGVCETAGGETNVTCPEDCGCGNGTIDSDEACDGVDLGGATCASLGYSGGDLACTDQCAYDTADCQGGECGNGQVESGEECDGADLHQNTCTDVGFDGGTLGCNAADCTFDTTSCCEDACPTAGQTRCASDIVEICQEGAAGCLEWIESEDCTDSGQHCVEARSGAYCDDACSDTCPEAGDLQCNGNVLEICESGGDGCLHWQTETDCGGGGQVCQTVGQTPQCVSTGPGDSCASPTVVSNFPFFVDGTDFNADFTNAHDFISTSGCGTAHGAEAVFQINLDAGDSIVLVEVGSIDVVIRVLDACDPTTGSCLLSFDFDEDDGHHFTAPATGDYFVVLEAYYETPYNPGYMFYMDRAELECTDGQDNDGDYRTDCEDPDCFGASCAPESICADDQDNDGDGLTDFDDPDCAPDNDTCAAPEDITGGGTIVASTEGAAADYGSFACGPDVTYQFDLNDPQLGYFTLTVEDPDPMGSQEIDYNVFVGTACPPDANWGSCYCASNSDPWCSSFPGVVERCFRLEAGTHYAVVQAGSPYSWPVSGAPFTLDVVLEPNPAIACGSLPDASSGGDFLLDETDPLWVNAMGTCNPTWATKEALFTLNVAALTNVTLSTPDRQGNLFLIDSCDADATPLAYEVPQFDLEPGNYHIVKEMGHFSGSGDSYLEVDFAAPGSACVDATPVTANANFAGDTTGGSRLLLTDRGGYGPEAVYEVQLSAETRVVADLIAQSQFTDPMLYFMHECMISETTDYSTSSPTHKDEVLQPGSYYLVVDGEDTDDSGEYILNVNFLSP